MRRSFHELDEHRVFFEDEVPTALVAAKVERQDAQIRRIVEIKGQIEALEQRRLEMERDLAESAVRRSAGGYPIDANGNDQCAACHAWGECEANCPHLTIGDRPRLVL